MALTAFALTQPNMLTAHFGKPFAGNRRRSQAAGKPDFYMFGEVYDFDPGALARSPILKALTNC